VALITSLVKFKVFCVLLLSLFNVLSNQLQARESFDFDLGSKINILSDKAFRKSNQNEFEAVGNVVISHLKNTLYGESAKINFTTGEVRVVGNVRYVAPEITLYGAELFYNFQSKIIEVQNARVLSDNYVVTGKKITQLAPNKIIAYEAEYTTCKDCPESWSLFGKKIEIDVGKYVYLTNAFIKIKGVVAMYIPYIVFPIKQKRESGVLFPLLELNSEEGMRYQQPLFWVIDDYKDLTLTPSTFGKRGIGGEFQYRQNVFEKTWFELNTLQLNDEIYAPYKNNFDKSGTKEYRHFSDLESHFTYKQFINGHIHAVNTSDLDTIRDLDFYAKEKMRGTDLGLSAFLDARNSLLSLSIQSFYNQNLLFNDPRKFDDQYVQILPKISLSSVPYNIVQSTLPFLKNVSIGFNSDFTVFKQNQVVDSSIIRNAGRLNLNPFVDWKLGNLGPLFFSNQVKLDYQEYRFSKETNEKKFYKQGIVNESEVKFELDKIYGLSYIEELPIQDSVKLDSSSNVKAGMTNAADSKSIIGSLPPFKASNENQTERVYHNSYRHSQEFKLKHYFLGEQKSKGSTKFKNQIIDDSGQFDHVDALRDREHLANQTTSIDSLPVSNTIEFQWNSVLIKKEPKVFDPNQNYRYLKDNFSYSEMAYFKLSQGLDLNVESSELEDQLTRLYVSTGLTIEKFTFGVTDYYSLKTGEQKLSTSLALDFGRFQFANTFSYNSYDSKNTPITKLLGYNVLLNINDLFTLKNSLDYNIESRITSESKYSVLYSPLNNCWKLEFNYARNLIERKVGFLFFINYNNNSFSSFNVR
jgi:LPS-assembly protein